MAEPFVAEIRIFGFDFAPKGWAHCDGQLLPLSQNTALFSLLGTTYGGNGITTFALPDLRERAPMQPGAGPGLSPHILGEAGGRRDVTLLTSELPQHGHPVQATSLLANSRDPAGRTLARSVGVSVWSEPGAAASAGLHPTALSAAGNSLPHDNMQPYLSTNFCIALQGIFPPRS